MRQCRLSLVGIVISAALGAVVGAASVGLGVATPAHAATIAELPPPAGSVSFGFEVLVLSNGNFVVSDPDFVVAAATGAGAVHLYNGVTNQLISTLTGSTLNDRIGSNGVFEVGTGNFIVRSPVWDNGAALDAGAVTWVNGTSGLNGVVSPANSLVGSLNFDRVGLGTEPVVLDNGNYFTISEEWGNPNSFGAATWSDGSQGTVGPVSASNSLIGSTDEDFANAQIYPLTNSNAVLTTPFIEINGKAEAGAVTWINGATGRAGVITPATSLYGTTDGDSVGSVLDPLTNGNYVVASPSWDNGLLSNVGAATWGDGAAGVVGPVSIANSVIGDQAGDGVGGGVTPLTNGNYVIQSFSWKNGVQTNAGAVMWASGAGPSAGTLTASNSIHGTVMGDSVADVTSLTNGNYVVSSSQVDIGGNVDAGGAMWASGTGPTAGAMSAVNSIVGSSTNDRVGAEITPLTNGNFVVRSTWHDGANAVGSTTLLPGTAPSVFAVSAANSLVGSTDGDGSNVLVQELDSGNYFVVSRAWTNAGVAGAGAVTWVNGATGIVGPISVANSLVGTKAGDGSGAHVQPLASGNALALWANWDAGATVDAGAATFLTGAAATSGVVSGSNSIVGSKPGDRVGWSADALDDGNALVRSPFWDDGATADAGVATWVNGNGPTAGPLSSVNSLVGPAGGGIGDVIAFPLPGGGYAVRSTDVPNGANLAAGAVTYSEPGGLTGTLTPSNTVFGLDANGGDFIEVARSYTAGDAVVVGLSRDNRVSLIITADKTPPSIATAADITVDAAPGATSAVVSYSVPTATDARSTPTVACNPPSGSEFPVGSTTVTCVATDGAGLTSSTTFIVTVVGVDDYVPLPPARVMDTRPGFATVDGLDAGAGLRDVGSTIELQVAGRGGVAANASAATLNVTAVDAVAPGFATVWPCGLQRPLASNLNFGTGATVPNAVLAKVGAGGKVCLFTSQPIHFVVDVNGYAPASTSYRPLNPARLLDTRADGVTVDGAQQRSGAVGADSTTTLGVRGRGGVPADATSVVLNVTTTESAADGYITAYPCGAPRPNASSVNGVAAKTVANLVIAKIGDNGSVCLYAQSAGHLIADVNGYFAGGSFTSLVPARLMDSRPGFATVDGQSAGAGMIPLGAITSVKVNGRGGVTAASTAVLNVTVTEPGAAGYITVYPCGIDPPNASNLNYATGQTVANGALVKVGDNGSVCLYNSQATQLIVDITGSFPG